MADKCPQLYSPVDQLGFLWISQMPHYWVKAHQWELMTSEYPFFLHIGVIFHVCHYNKIPEYFRTLPLGIPWQFLSGNQWNQGRFEHQENLTSLGLLILSQGNKGGLRGILRSWGPLPRIYEYLTFDERWGDSLVLWKEFKLTSSLARLE